MAVLFEAKYVQWGCHSN